MNKQNAHQYLPLVQALAEGKTIQIQMNAGWMDVSHDVDLRWDLPPESYRIKPEPREWTGKIIDTRWSCKGIGEFSICFRGDMGSIPELNEIIRIREILD
jgi:hypothetical protein